MSDAVMLSPPPMDRQVGGKTATRVGYAVIALAFGGLGTWAALAPLHAAAVASGEVKVEGYRKTLQHREGGIVRDILVRDGDQVAAGQPVLRLDDTLIRAQWTQLTLEYWDVLGTRARLLAERDGAATIDFAELDGAGAHPKLAEIRQAQINLFRSRRALLDGKVAVLNERRSLQEHEATALRAEQVSKDRQLALIRDELKDTAYLVQRGLGRKPRLLALQRDAERLQGERDDYTARIARLRQAQASAQLDIANVGYEHLSEVAADLRAAEARLRELEQQIAAARDALQRTVLRSPQDGVVMDVRVHTRGAVLQPGEEVMDVVPGNERLIVEARISPEDIDRVMPGRDAQVRFRTFLRGLTPPALGRVTQVSADLMHDQRTNQPYYNVRVDLDEASLRRLPGPLTPGMQTDVLIITGQRTALQYMLAPLTRAMNVALREK